MSRVLITGTSTGIGQATALRLAADGHDVIASMRNLEKADELQTLAAERGFHLTYATLDVNDDTSVTNAVAELTADRPIDVLVNNAGMSPVGAVEDFPVDRWKELFETNVFGVVRCTQAVLPGMRAQNSGHIINISSVAGRTAIPIFGPYAASKWAVEAMSESLAAEAAIFDIAVTVIEPGAIATPIRGKTGAPDRNSPYRPVAKNWGFSVGYDHARASEPEEVAAAIAEAIAHPTPPLRVTVGTGVDEMIALREQHTDAEWIDLWSADTGDFLQRMQQHLGVDLTDPVD